MGNPSDCYTSSNRVYFNYNSNGIANNKSKMVCKLSAQPVPSLEYGTSPFNTISCNEGYTKVTTVEDCQKAASELDFEYRYAVNTGFNPSDCYTSSNRVYFNYNSNGIANNKSKMVCKLSAQPFPPTPSAPPTSQPVPPTPSAPHTSVPAPPTLSAPPTPSDPHTSVPAPPTLSAPPTP